jgi:hypothetical protein
MTLMDVEKLKFFNLFFILSFGFMVETICQLNWYVIFNYNIVTSTLTPKLTCVCCFQLCVKVNSMLLAFLICNHKKKIIVESVISN